MHFSHRPKASLHVGLCLAWAVLSIVSLPGCHPNRQVSPDTISQAPHASGDGQSGLCGQPLAQPLRVLVQGPKEPGVLGGKGSRQSACGVPVTFTISSPDSDTVFVDNGASTTVQETDAAGIAAANVLLGTRPGDTEIAASVDTPKGTRFTSFRVLTGVEVVGKDLEAPAGETIDAFGVRLTDVDGTPAQGVDVYFRVEGGEDGASIGATEVRTDEAGLATTSWALGKDTGRNFASVTIRDRRSNLPDSQRFDVREIEFEAMSVNKMAMALELFGGLAVFIFGMKLMSDGLRRMADRRLKSILQAMTRNRFLATGVGAGLTAMVQSSSAVTVMTVGFVNAGLITLTQAIGVVYGANIGTTITAQIIAFKLDNLAYPAIALGLIISTVARRPNVKAFGEAILGFGLLFLGMKTMSGTLKPLRHSPEFVSWFQLFDCSPGPSGIVRPGAALMCILVGTIATVVVQSSSATVGLVLALSSQGLLTFYTAVPLVLGDNIGTTITAVFASIGANRNARRTALAHTLFNVIGASYMYLLLFLPFWHGQPVFLGLVDAVTPGDAFAAEPENLMRHVANAHTTFNLINCSVFLFFVGPMARLCQRIIPLTDADRETVLQYLEPHLLNAPSLALEQAVKEVAYMLRRAQKSINEGCAFFFGGPRELEEKLLIREDVIDRLQEEITSYLVELSRKPLQPSEAALIPALIHVVNDAERVGDHSENLVELTHLARQGNHYLSPTALETVQQFQDLLNQQFQAILDSLNQADPSVEQQVLAREETITALVQDATEAHVQRLERQECKVQAGVIFLDLLAHLERVGDHLVNIAERTGVIVRVTGK